MATSTSPPAGAIPDGLDLLEADHRLALLALGNLVAVTSRTRASRADAGTQVLAAEIAAAFETHLCAHEVDEELHVFACLPSEYAERNQPVMDRLQHEHDRLGDAWRQLGPRLHAIAAGHVDVEPEAMHQDAMKFAALLRAHIAREEAWIYPQARATFDADTRLRMGEAIAARRRSLLAGGRLDASKAPPEAANVQTLRALLISRLVALRWKASAAGDFGRCIDCGEPVGEAQLLRQPSAPRCIACQAAHEAKAGRSV